MTAGGLCDQFLIRADKLHVSQNLDFRQLALVETLAIGYHATQRGQPNAGDHVLVIGAGPIGLATLEFTRLTGAQVTVMDLSRERLQFCRANDNIANTVCWTETDSVIAQLREITGNDLYQVVIDATGNAGSMERAVEFVAPTGTLVYVGITSDELKIPHPKMHRPEVTIKASRNALPGDFTEIIRLIEGGQVDVTPWITDEFGFDDFIGRFPTLIEGNSNTIKAIVQIQS
jgi:alcohol dehydrogenase